VEKTDEVLWVGSLAHPDALVGTRALGPVVREDSGLAPFPPSGGEDSGAPVLLQRGRDLSWKEPLAVPHGEGC